MMETSSSRAPASPPFHCRNKLVIRLACCSTWGSLGKILTLAFIDFVSRLRYLSRTTVFTTTKEIV
jgi:hypothetical protein